MPKRKESPAELTHISERSLPSNINAEAAVLSAMLIDKDAANKGVSKLKEEYLYRTPNKIIFRLMQELLNENSEMWVAFPISMKWQMSLFPVPILITT
jgi:hypothetical protein